MIDHKKRARSLLRKMSVREKVAQLYSVWLKIEADGSFSLKGERDESAESRSGDPKELLKYGIGQITRPLGTRPIDAVSCVKGFNNIQKYLVENTRLKIPALAHEECLPGLMAKGATLFPTAINYASLWDEDLMKSIASVIGKELYSVGSRQGLSPVLDVSRDVRWGRTEETFGEDPYLAGCMAVAYVRGLQGDQRRVLATLKHFAGHAFSEGGRNHAPVNVGQRVLNDIFLLPFEMAVKLANAGSVMPAYHDIDGEPASSSRHYMAEILREEWGFDGITVSDYGAITLLHTHHGIARDKAEAAALALQAGMDMELPDFTCFRKGIEEALNRGILKIKVVDQAVMRVLIEKSRLGLFENPYADPGAVKLNTGEHRRIAFEAAAKSMVLLKNDGILPLEDSGTIALIGPLADDQYALFGGYSFPVHNICTEESADDKTAYAKTLRQALTERLTNSTILYSRGCDLITARSAEAPVFPGDLGVEKEQGEFLSSDQSGIPEAVEVAKRADRIIVAVGDLAGLFQRGTVGEGSDVSSLALPGVQQQLIDALLALNKLLIIVMFNGRPYNLGNAFSTANAVVEAWFPGQEGASALVELLYGHINPGGRLPLSFPKSAGAMPYFYNHKFKSAGSPRQSEFGALFPFGHGLSYTTFNYDDFRIEKRRVPINGEIEIACSIKNTGKTTGDEVVQLYTRDLLASLARPLKELKGFKRLTIKPGERKRVIFSLPVDMLGFTIAGTTRIVEPGEFEIMIGRSSQDIIFSAKIEVIGSTRRLPKKWRMMSSAYVT